MRPRGIVADIGGGAAAAVLVLTLLAGARAAALVLIAESLAGSISDLADGHGVSAEVVVLGLGGVVLRALSSWGTTALAARVAAAAKRRWRARLTQHIASDGASGGAEETVLATQGLDALDGYLGAVLPAVVAAVVIPLGLGLRILFADPLSALIVAITVPLIPVFMILIGMHSRDRAEAAAGALARLADHLVELAEGLPVLVGLGRATEQTAALARIQGEYRRRLDRAVRGALLSALALELIATLSVAVVAVTLGVRLLSGSVGLDVALLVLLLAPDCFAAIREVGAAYHQAQDGSAALRRVREILARSLPAVGRRAGAPVLRRVTVAYPGRRTIGPLTHRLPRTGVVVLRGISGSGKSTLLDTIAGVLPADAVVGGEIEGMPAHDLAVTRQTPRFAAPTPAEELALVGPGHDGVLAELGLAGLADADIGRLSPGEQRRLAVARALVRVDDGARILLLDEPTAHLDAESAALVLGAVRRRATGTGMLTLLASHDARVTALADETIELPGPVGEPPVWSPPSVTVAPPPRRGIEVAEDPAPISPLGTAGRWLAAVALAALAGGMAAALSAVSGWLIVRAAAQPEIMYLLVAIVGVRFFGLGRAVARYAERVVGHGAALRLVDDVRLRLWRRLAERGAAARGARDAGNALELLVNLPAQLRDLLPRVIPPLLGGLGVALAAALVILGLAPTAWPAAVLILAGGLLAPVSAWLADRRWQLRGVATQVRLGRRFASFATASDDLRANGSVRESVDALGALALDRERQERRQAIVTASAGVVAGSFTGVAAVIAPLLVHPAELAAVVALLALACLEPIAGAASAAQRIPSLTAVIGRLRAGFAGPSVRHGDAAINHPVRRLAVRGAVLGWTPGRPLTGELDVEVRSPGWLVVDGPSGSGKTTLVTAVLGDLDPVAGDIRADGADLRSLDRDAWHDRVAWCPQEAHVFDSSLRANLLIARPRTDPVAEGEMREVLGSVGLAHLVADAAEGLDLRVGRRGSALSGGERQRLAVARAILRRCDVLLLDEPTAHLDDATADAMMEDLRRATGDRIVLLVSHREGDRRPEDQLLSLGRSGDRLGAPAR